MSPDPFESQSRPRVVRGEGSLSRLGELAREHGAQKVLCVTDPGIVSAGHLERALRSLRDARIEAVVFDAVEENPTTDVVERGLEVARHARMDFLVAVGGGSSMDCAKGVNFLYSCGGEMRDYRGKGRATGPMLGLIAVPTTAGTGSENQSYALISDPVTHEKMACGDKKALPLAAILDPELTLTCPPEVTANVGVDAIAHAVETFVTKVRTPDSRECSRHAWKLLARAIEGVLESPADPSLRRDMLYGASYAGAAIERSMLGAAHAAANPITARKGQIHGRAVGLMLPHVVRFNASLCDSDYRELLEMAGRSPSGNNGAGSTLAFWLDELLEKTGLPRRLDEVGVGEDELEALAGEAAGQWTAQFNPKPLTEADFLELYRAALRGPEAQAAT